VSLTTRQVLSRLAAIGAAGACALVVTAATEPSPASVRGADRAAHQIAGVGSTDAAPGEWRSLFDGRTTNGWRGYRSAEMPSGWRVVNGALTKDSSTGDIQTSDEFGNFELELEWRIGPGGNSGVFYRGTEEYDHIYWSAPEYQLLDDAGAPDGRSRLTAAGSAYGLYPSPAGIVKPADRWNSTRIILRGAHVEHWLNGHKLLEYELGSPDWEARVKASKFVAWPHYGRATSGHIGIQGDHSGALAVRQIRIRVLP
jgi:hypothetical protein